MAPSTRSPSPSKKPIARWTRWCCKAAGIRRTATTIGQHLVEGANAPVERESSIPLQSAITATSQLEYQVLLAHDLGYLDGVTHEELTTEIYEIRRMMQTHLVRVRSLR